MDGNRGAESRSRTKASVGCMSASAPVTSESAADSHAMTADDAANNHSFAVENHSICVTTKNRRAARPVLKDEAPFFSRPAGHSQCTSAVARSNAGLKPLREAGRIKNDRNVGGYYRTDAPPEKFKHLLLETVETKAPPKAPPA